MNGPAPIAVYLYAGDQIIENVTMGYFYFQDSLGNTSHVTDAAGNLLERYTYSAFGTPTFYNAGGGIIYNSAGISESALGIKHLFQGQLWTQETGLNDYRNRVELPAMGVFLQPDPLGFKGDAANIYRFCGNDPVDRTDPLGLEGEIFGPGELESAVGVARHQIETAVTDPNRQPVTTYIRQKGTATSRPLTYYPSKMVPILGYGKGYKVGPTIDGRVVYVNGTPFELEKAPDALGRVVIPVHSHNDKRGENVKTPGIALPKWSSFDEGLPNVDRMDESRPGVWHSRRNGKEVSASDSFHPKATSDAGNGLANGVTGSSTDLLSAPSAAEVDAAHQTTGVPSLGGESVNRINGPL